MADTRPADRPPLEAVRIAVVPRHGNLIVLFAAQLSGLLTHWSHGRSWGCAGPDDCAPALHKCRTVWKGYAPARVWEQARALWVPHVFEATEVLEEQLRGRTLAGEVWLVERANERKRQGPCRGSFLTRREDPELVEPFEIRPALYRFYQTTKLDLGVSNPLPPKVFLPAVAAAGPPLADPSPAADPGPPTGQQHEALRRLAARGRGAAPVRNGRK